MLIGIDASRAVVVQRTGTEYYSLQVIRHLVRVGSEHRFRLYLRQSAPPGLLPAGPNVEYRVLGPQRLWTHLGLSWEVARRPPEVLFVPAHVVPIVHPAATVVTVHDLGYRFFPRQHTLGARLYLEASTRFSSRVARLVIADSQVTARDLAREYGVPMAKIRVIYPGLDAGISRASAEARAAVCERYGLPRPFILYVGTIQPRKNLVRLVEAFARIAGNWDGLDLVLAGKTGWLADGIYRRAQELGLGERVRFPGYVAEEDLPALFSAAQCFVMPSLYEGFGLPVLEAMACGTPVLASDAGSLPEVAGDAALLFPPQDTEALATALHHLLRDPDLRRELVARGYRRCSEFSWERCAEGILEVLVEASRRRAG